jgi:hypothetical protein
MRLRCPHCQCWLRDQRQLRLTDLRVIAYLGALLLMLVLPIDQGLRIGLLAVIFAVFIVVQRRHARAFPDQARYVLDDVPPKRSEKV